MMLEFEISVLLQLLLSMMMKLQMLLQLLAAAISLVVLVNDDAGAVFYAAAVNVAAYISLLQLQ